MSTELFLPKIKNNVVANIVGRAWGFAAIYLFVPIYLRFLGAEAYGMVGFYSTLMGILSFADMGFTATVNREIARLSVQRGNQEEMSRLLQTYEMLYAALFILISAAIWFSAPSIARQWLHAETLNEGEIETAIRLMGIASAFQLPFGLYISGLMGLQLQVRGNLFQMGSGALRSVLTSVALWLVSPTVVTFACCQLFINGVCLYVVRRSTWDVVGRRPAGIGVSRKILKATWRYTAGMAGIAATSTLLTQLDKLLISKMLPLTLLGYYTLAGTIAMVPLMAASSIGQAFYPKFSGLVVAGARRPLSELYHLSSALVATVILPVGITLMFFARSALWAWTGSVVTAQSISLVTVLLLAGQVLQALTVIPFYISLAYGSTRLILYVQIISVLLLIPLLLISLKKFGMDGAGLSWLVLNLFTIPPYMILLHRRLLPGEFFHWCFRDVARPALAVIFVVALCHYLMPNCNSRLWTLGLLVGVMCIAFAAGAAMVTPIRDIALGKIMQVLGRSYE